MKKSHPRITAALLVLLALAAIVVVAAFAEDDRGKKQAPKANGHPLEHVFVIMLENHSQSSVIGDENAPFITSLAHTYATANDYFGVTHPSEPNYVAAISGSNWGVNDDRPTNTYNHVNIVDQLEQHHLSWAAYMESMPSAGFTGAQFPAGNALYVNKHNPFVLMSDIRSNRKRMAQIKPYARFADDMKASRLPNFVWITPNECHDMHGGVSSKVAADGSDGTPCPSGAAEDDPNDAALKQKADDFVKGAVTTIMSTTAWKTGRSAIFILTDESDFTGEKATDGWESTEGCCDSPNLAKGTPFRGSNGAPDGSTWRGGVYGGGKIPAIVMTARGKRGYTSHTPYNHYSLLSTLEWNWDLPRIGKASDTANVRPMTEFFTK